MRGSVSGSRVVACRRYARCARGVGGVPRVLASERGIRTGFDFRRLMFVQRRPERRWIASDPPRSPIAGTLFAACNNRRARLRRGRSDRPRDVPSSAMWGTASSPAEPWAATTRANSSEGSNVLFVHTSRRDARARCRPRCRCERRIGRQCGGAAEHVATDDHRHGGWGRHFGDRRRLERKPDRVRILVVALQPGRQLGVTAFPTEP